ncbi:MAG: RNA 2',3'-cyclic phosphodiesterase [Planctomycetota bacterium]|nr:RNA 2',3'-cyclic phosphodiesterase [Planctomycetota bacterium]
MRCFVAFDLPRPVRNHLDAVTAPLRDRYDIRWVPPDQMHLTLLFAGDIDDAGVDALAGAVDRCDAAPLTLSLQSFGVFPARGIPRVVWAGLCGDVESVREAKGAFEAIGARLDIPREKRAFTPHVTIGRVKSPFGALALIDQLAERSQDLKDKPFQVPSLTLYESRLTPRGPRYEVVTRRALGGAR